jgi:5-(carboxyamino)imidazole ribonucleotide synthase
MTTVLPGSIVGVLGSGQLGRMFAIAARRMGYRVHTYSPDADTPTGQVADIEIQGAYEDLDAVEAFAKNVSVVTFEFENVPFATTVAAEKHAPVRPAGSVLHTSQQRLREKSFLRNAGLPVADFFAVRTLADLEAGIRRVGLPCVLKTASFGYDGKGQSKIDTVEQAAGALKSIAGHEAIVEAWVDFEREVSVVAARGIDGSFAHWGVIENDHRHHILDVSTAPATVPAAVEKRAIELARTVLEQLQVVGVLCIEMFLTRRGELLINELAPRPHNSGHLTFDASVTSQFEQQLRAVCGLPLGSTELLHPAAMANLLGDLWAGGEPDWASALAIPDVKLHLYGKIEPRRGRKMGHLTALAGSSAEAREKVLEARRRLTRS